MLLLSETAKYNFHFIFNFRKILHKLINIVFRSYLQLSVSTLIADNDDNNNWGHEPWYNIRHYSSQLVRLQNSDVDEPMAGPMVDDCSDLRIELLLVDMKI